MDKEKRTNRDITRFINTAQVWLQQETLDSKLKYAIMRILPSCRKASDKFQMQLTDIAIDHAEEDDKKHLLKHPDGDFIYTKQGNKDRNAAQHKLVEEEAEIDVYYSTSTEAKLNPLTEEAFYGFVIKRPTEPKEE